ncbi:hypothetical protein MKW98_002808, partial [Papaver atlanticum]
LSEEDRCCSLRSEINVVCFAIFAANQFYQDVTHVQSSFLILTSLGKDTDFLEAKYFYLINQQIWKPPLPRGLLWTTDMYYDALVDPNTGKVTAMIRSTYILIVWDNESTKLRVQFAEVLETLK